MAQEVNPALVMTWSSQHRAKGGGVHGTDLALVGKWSLRRFSPEVEHPTTLINFVSC